MDGNEVRETTKVITDLTKAGFTPEEIAVVLDNPYQAYKTELGRIGVLVMIQRGMSERKLVKQIGTASYLDMEKDGLIVHHEGQKIVSLTDKGRRLILEYALKREREEKKDAYN